MHRHQTLKTVVLPAVMAATGLGLGIIPAGSAATKPIIRGAACGVNQFGVSAQPLVCVRISKTRYVWAEVPAQAFSDVGSASFPSPAPVPALPASKAVPVHFEGVGRQTVKFTTAMPSGPTVVRTKADTSCHTVLTDPTGAPIRDSRFVEIESTSPAAYLVHDLGVGGARGFIAQCEPGVHWVIDVGLPVSALRTPRAPEPG